MNELDVIKEQANIVFDVIQKHASKHSNEHLSGWCAIASRILHIRLQRRGIKTTYCHVDDYKSFQGHCFLIYKGMIIDVTAKQFKYIHRKNELLVIDKIEKLQKYWFWRVKTKRNSFIFVDKHNKTSDFINELWEWPVEQHPKDFMSVYGKRARKDFAKLLCT